MRALAYAIATENRPRGPRRAPPVRRRPSPNVRRLRKLRAAIPASLAVFRKMLRAPLHEAAPEVGSTVLLSAEKRSVGRVEDVIVGVKSGRTAYVVAAPDIPEDWRLLIPQQALRTRDQSIALADPADAVAIPRKVTSAA